MQRFLFQIQKYFLNYNINIFSRIFYFKYIMVKSCFIFQFRDRLLLYILNPRVSNVFHDKFWIVNCVYFKSPIVKRFISNCQYSIVFHFICWIIFLLKLLIANDIIYFKFPLVNFLFQFLDSQLFFIINLR